MEIRKSLNRFLSIFFIVAMGVAFFTGIHASAPDMRLTGDAYFDESSLMDIRVISTLGLTQADLDALGAIEGVETVNGCYMEDVYFGDAKEQNVLHIESIPEQLNQLTVEAGALPQKAGECFLDSSYAAANAIEPGDVLMIAVSSEEDSMLKNRQYTVSGYGSSPCYLSFDRGTTTLGTGKISAFAYVVPEEFDAEVYSVAYLSVAGAKEESAYTEPYDALVEAVYDRIEEGADARCEIRYDEVRQEAEEALADGKQEVEDGKQELLDAKKELAEAEAEMESELAQAEAELLEGESELENGKQELEAAQAELAEGEQQLFDGEREIEANERDLANGKTQLAQAQEKLNEGEAEYQSGLEAYEKTAPKAEKQLKQAEKKIKAGKAQLKTGWEEYQTQLSALEAGETQLAQAKEQLTQSQAQYDASYESTKAQLDAGKAAYEAGMEQLSSGKQEYQAAVEQLSIRQSEYDQGRTALDAAWTSYQAAQAQLAQGQTQYEGALAELEAKKSTYEKTVQEAAAWRETQRQLEAEKAQAEEAGDAELAAKKAQEAQAAAEQAAQKENSLLEQEREIQEAEAALTQQKSVLDQQSETLKGTKTELEQQETALAAAKTALDAGRMELQGKKAELDAAESQLFKAKEEVDAGYAALTAAKSELDAGWEQISIQETTLSEGRKKLSEAKKTLETSEKELAEAEDQQKKGEKELSNSKKQLNSAREELDLGWTQLRASQTQLSEGEQQLSDAKSQMEAARKELEDAQEQLADGQKELAENEQKLEDGWKEYEDGKKEAQEEIADARQELSDAEQELSDAEQELSDAEEEINEIKYPKWYVSDRSALPENSGFGENAERMSSLARVFPVMFFLVAALISLTTMTRMVEEERTQIGTMKALGYSRWDIAGKYLKYAFYATIGGSIVGTLFGEKFFPWVIITAYGIMYQNIPRILLPYNLTFAVMATGAALFCTIGATVSACYRVMQEVPAQLMRPPAPKEGKRIFLERIWFLWRPLKFAWKSTIRNLMRYKKRCLMTVIGIGGCMGLLLVGYGLRDSIMGIGILQFQEVQKYSAMVILDTDTAEQSQEAAFAHAAKADGVDVCGRYYMQLADIQKEAQNGKPWSVYICVPEQMETLDEFFCFRERGSKEVYELTDEGAILTEKVAKELGVSAGDCITVKQEDGEEAVIPIQAVCENYLSHYLYLTPVLYEQVFGEAAAYNCLFYKSSAEEETIREIGSSLLDCEAVLNITYTEDLEEQLSNMLTALDMVMIVLIIAAGLLAFVVLYNLNNININERRRELATLKVLGFFDGEVAAYVYRENVILTLIGAAFGCLVGKFLHLFVITTVEVESAMFGRNINPESYLTAAAFTILFSCIVNLVMYFKLKKIDMVESLKSIE